MRVPTDDHKLIVPGVELQSLRPPIQVRRFDEAHPSSVDSRELLRVLDPIKQKVRIRQIDLMPQFKHHDKNNMRAVTVSQFKRARRLTNCRTCAY